MSDTATQDTNQMLGAVLEGMIRWDKGLTNNLIDSHIDSAIRWARRFEERYRLVDRDNRDLYVARVLDEFAYEYGDVDRSIEHLKSLRMNKEN